MAERRMFAKTIIDSDAFLDMPLSTQALYFHLSMRADDEGFVNNPKKIQRMIGATDGDAKELIRNNFIIVFDSGVIVIKHWKIHNYIRGDRIRSTPYQEERKSLEVKANGAYTLIGDITTDAIPDALPDVCLPIDGQLPDKCQHRIGKDRIGKVSIVEVSVGECEGETADEPPAPAPAPYEAIKSLYNTICKSFPRCKALSDARRKAIKARFVSGYTLEDFETLFTKAEKSSFLKGRNNRNWTASFDWLIKDANMAKVLDGNYDDHHQGGPDRNDDLDFIPN